MCQGLYFLATGVWPLVSLRTFEGVTRPRVDSWLVKSVSVLVSAIGDAAASRSKPRSHMIWHC